MYVTRDLSRWFCGTRELFVSFRENPNFFLKFSKLLAPSGSVRIYDIGSRFLLLPFRSHTVKYSGYQTSKGQFSIFETSRVLAVLVVLFVTAWKRTSKSYLPRQI